ncbi:peptide ligase PGM1-related protein [Flavihumibacter rivuli]|uniref:peptide ligase PGM1-related protein n=1 Tax=Flavihumibacter rivuli TaxID=2838156 RepID=UPI001BDF0276|nr:peptide ligase PGM1-related protein [Flavihumibacter rivuli]ULQ56869.1 peptide ligase PGM1-related protein [Flavihumibacter rivuli]
MQSPPPVRMEGIPLANMEGKLGFPDLQEKFRKEFPIVFPDEKAEKTVVIIPSLTLDQEILSKINGVVHYEERMLCMLMLLRMPRTHVVYVTSTTIDPVIVDYYLSLLPGITGYHARQRLHLLSCNDASPKSLTEKILDRPRLIERIKTSIPAGHAAHLAFFNVTNFEKELAVRLQLPVYGCDPGLDWIGSKSGGRSVFRDCGAPMPDGMEGLVDRSAVVDALHQLKQRHSNLRKAVIKMEEGFSGEGNAVFTYSEGRVSTIEIRDGLMGNTCPVAPGMSAAQFFDKFDSMGGIVECFVEGETKRSPSVQCRITPTGEVDIISTHDQLLGGNCGQVFLGASFPADRDYAASLAKEARMMAGNLKDKGVLGRFSIDFISVKDDEGLWRHYAIEINLRKGGTTHPFLMLQFLTNGIYAEGEGIYHSATGRDLYYYSSDNLYSPSYIGLTPHDLIDIAMMNGLQYDGSRQQGVMFHLIGALSQYGKLGVVCIGHSPGEAIAYYQRIIEVLEKESGKC